MSRNISYILVVIGGVLHVLGVVGRTLPDRLFLSCRLPARQSITILDGEKQAFHFAFRERTIGGGNLQLNAI
jgi:hypothetical protein